MKCYKIVGLVCMGDNLTIEKKIKKNMYEKNVTLSFTHDSVCLVLYLLLVKQMLSWILVSYKQAHNSQDLEMFN